MTIALMTHIWQSTFFALAAGLLTVAFGKNRAQVRYWLWLSASLKFIVPFALLMSLGSQWGWSPFARKIATPAVSLAVEYVAEPFAVSSVGLVMVPAPKASRVDWIPGAVFGAWLCGVAGIGLMRLRNWRGIRAALRSGVPLRLNDEVEARVAPGLLEPGVVGLLRPVLLLPEGIVERLTPTQLDAVVAHELCHVRRRDNLFAAAHMVVEAVFWFHPLVWWIGARLLEERERACDEEVLSLGNQPRVYADAILGVCRLYVESPLACVSGVTGSDIRRRIEAIMTNRRLQSLSGVKKVILACAGLLAVAGPVAIGLVVGVGHVPLIRAQVSAPAPASPLKMDQSILPIPASPAPTNASSQVATAPGAIPAVPSELRYVDRRLVAMLFDFSGMAPAEQTREQEMAVEFIRSQLKPADLICIMMRDTGLEILQDFTNDKGKLEAAVRQFAIGETATNGNASATDINAKLATVETATKLLGGFPGKKAVMYFSSGITQSGVDNQAQLRALIDVAKQANVAIYPVDARGADAPAVAPVGSSGGRGGMVPVPTGVAQDEYGRRVAYATAHFGSATGAMGRTYIKYGPPDEIYVKDAANNRVLRFTNPMALTDPPDAQQIWRYHYLELFHSNVEFELTSEKGVAGVRINYPAPMATWLGESKSDTTLANSLYQEGRGRGTVPATAPDVVAGLPGRHASFQTYPAGEVSVLSVPLDGLSGDVDIAGVIRTVASTGAVGDVKGAVRDGSPASAGTWRANFTLSSGLYVCSLVVREKAAGHMYGETIHFEVK